MEPVQMRVEPSETRVRCGNLEVDFDEMGRGTVTVDGTRMSVRKIAFRSQVGSLPVCEMEFFPRRSDLNTVESIIARKDEVTIPGE